jgi:alkanesulfonate monooxygenase SsuD/methylene tetrahydromethanopterin reductase-like flavin-dependent oxidoreductase (luciferase family)
VSPIELKFCDLDPENTVAMLIEVEEIISRGLYSDTLTYHGTHYHYEYVPMTINPIQNPIPMWSAAKSPEGLDMASKRGMHSVALGSTETVKAVSASYRDYWELNSNQRSASAPEVPYVGAYRLIYVNEDEGKAREIGEAAFDDWCRKLEKLWKENNLSVPFLTMLGSFDIAKDCGMMVCGTPDQVIEELKLQVDDTGVNYFALQLAFGNLGHDEEMRSLERFAMKVMPTLKTD